MSTPVCMVVESATSRHGHRSIEPLLSAASSGPTAPDNRTLSHSRPPAWSQRPTWTRTGDRPPASTIGRAPNASEAPAFCGYPAGCGAPHRHRTVNAALVRTRRHFGRHRSRRQLRCAHHRRTRLPCGPRWVGPLHRTRRYDRATRGCAPAPGSSIFTPRSPGWPPGRRSWWLGA